MSPTRDAGAITNLASFEPVEQLENVETGNDYDMKDDSETQCLADSQGKTPTILQRHVQFWDRDNDGIIHPWDVYNGFRELGFGHFFSFGSLLIPIFFSYPTRLGHSWIPDPMMRIYVRDIHKAKHGSDTGIYDFDGNLDPERFEQLFRRFDSAGTGGLSSDDLWRLWKKNHCAADPAGWSFAFMEWWSTWVLLQRDGKVWKDDLRACYEGTLFWKIKKEREDRELSGEKDRKFGMRNFFYSA